MQIIVKTRRFGSWGWSWWWRWRTRARGSERGTILAVAMSCGAMVTWWCSCSRGLVWRTLLNLRPFCRFSSSRLILIVRKIFLVLEPQPLSFSYKRLLFSLSKNSVIKLINFIFWTLKETTHFHSFPRVLLSSALWRCGYCSANFRLAAWAQTFKYN